MSEKNIPTRFAHLEGHTDCCYSDDGRYVFTCGLDGDVRIFENLEDDECKTYAIADEVHCIAFQNNCIVAGTSFNIIQSYTVDEGKPSGIITRCKAFPTHINVSRDKKLIAVASSDMTAKVHDTENFQDLEFSGHEAPVLSVAIDPLKTFLATSSCDGTVRVWNYHTQTMVRSFPLIPKSNDFAFSSTLCRLCWSLDGQHLIVPVGSELKVYNRSNWKVEFTLAHSSVTGIASVSVLSPCGQYVALGCRDGRIAVWDLKTRSCVTSEKLQKGMAITGLVWHPKGKEELSFVSSGGEFGVLRQFLKGASALSGTQKNETSKKCQENNANPDVFPPLDDTDLLPPGATTDVDPPSYLASDDDESEISIAKIKSQLGFADDAEGTFIGVPKPFDDGETSRPASRIETPLPTPTVPAPKLPEPQKPFQPSMSPEHLSDRYMLWNNTGLVLQYENEEEHSIEVEFHDSSVHHPFHVNNNAGLTMAALNNEALALASESQDGQLSKLVVNHFSAWDGSREWLMDMAEGEEILAVAIGTGWVAVATDLRFLRIFSLAGVQRDVLSIPGPVVCLAGFEKNILIVFHSGIGVCGEQSMSAMVLNIDGRRHMWPTPFPLSLSPKSFLAWAGFTDEGTPMIMDSSGVVRLLSKRMGASWCPVLNTKLHAKGKSDHYFLLGASEVQSIVRCILCKGARYPPVLPKPHVSLLNLKVPLCDPEIETSVLEETVIRSMHLSSTIDSLVKDGFAMDAAQKENSKTLKEAMVKLFAVACRAEREARGVEICEWMPTPDMVEVAVKYAAKLHRMQLAERLNEVIQRKVEDSLRVEEEDEKEMVVYRRPERQAETEYYNDEGDFARPSPVETEPESMEVLMKKNPLLAASCKQNKESSPRIPLTPGSRNPFKRVSGSLGHAKGMHVLDSLKAGGKDESGPPVLKPIMKKPKVRQTSLKPSTPSSAATVIEVPNEKENKTTNTTETTVEISANNNPVSKEKRPSALKLWMDDNIEMVKQKFPNATDKELFGKSAMIFKDVDESIKQRYKAKAAEPLQTVNNINKNDNGIIMESETIDERKRKSEVQTTEEPKEKKIKQTVGSKLAGFAFSKKNE